MANVRSFKTSALIITILFILLGGLQLSAQAAPTATTGTADGIQQYQATVHGTVNANGSETTVYFEYGTTTGYGSTMPGSPGTVTGSASTAVSAILYELSVDTTYHYRLVAENGEGTVYGSDMTFTTLPYTPGVSTEPATSVTTEGATLIGTVSPHGHSTTVTFEYGTDTGYGTTVTATPSPVTGYNNYTVFAAITGLSPDTTYYFRAVGTNAYGSGYGSAVSFTTGSSSAPAAATGGSSGVTATTATLSGTVNAGHAETAVSFEYGLDTSYGNTAAATPPLVTGATDTEVTANLGELLPNTLYYFRVVAENANGTAYGDPLSFTTQPGPPTALTVAASPVGTTDATLNGSVNANGDSSIVTFEYGLDTGYGTVTTADQSPVIGTTATAVSKTISGLTNGITYHYRVVAVNAGGTSYGEDMTFTAGATAPTAVTAAASSITTTAAVLNGTVNANASDTTVTFEYGLDATYGKTINASPGTVTGSVETPVSASINSLVSGTTYHYRVVAVNSGGTTYGADLTFTTRSAPTVFTTAATAVGIDGATLNGTVNANNDSATVTFEYGTDTGYGNTVTADQSPVTGTSDTAVSVVLSGLTTGTVYHYRVVGVNADGTSYGEDMTFKPTAATAPTAVTGAATAVLSTGATLNGTVNANNSDTTVTFEYGLDTSYGTTVTAAQGTITGAFDTAVNATITGLSNNTTYHYRVVAQNANGTTNGADMTFTTSSLPTAVTQAATGISTGTATLNGTINKNAQTYVRAYFQYGLSTSYGGLISATPNFVTEAGDTPVSLPLTGLTPGTTYYFRVVAVQPNNSQVYGEDMTFTTVAQPTAVTGAASGVGAATATLNGTVNANNTTAAVSFEWGLNTSYGMTSTASPGTVTGASDTAVTVSLSSLSPNRTYHYRVVADNGTVTVYGDDMTFSTLGAGPAASTEAATSITANGAVLNGTVRANFDSTTVSFEYGTTTAYGSTVTADQSPATGGGLTPVSVSLSGLAGSTTYHFRVVAVNGSGTAYGGDLTFNTGVTAPTVTTGAASNVTSSGALLRGTVNANNGSTTVTFQFGPTSGYGRTFSASPSTVTGSGDTAVSFQASSLPANTTFHYRVVGVNAGGTSYGSDRTFTTGSANAPSVTTAAITNIGNVSAGGGGTVIEEGGAPVTARGMCWSTSPVPTIAGSLTNDGTGAGTFTSSITGLTPETTYYARAYATNVYGTAYGDEVTFTTLNIIVTVEITNPADGDIVAGTVNITANASVSPSTQSIDRVDFYIDGALLSQDTAAPYEAPWDTSAGTDGNHTIRAVAVAGSGDAAEAEISVYVLNNPPVLQVNPGHLNYGAVIGGEVTGPQALTIANSGGGTLDWSLSFTASWLSCTPASGQAPGTVVVTVDASGLAAGTYNDTITVVNDSYGVSGGSVTIPVLLTVLADSEGPFGTFESPANNATVSGSVPLTGWALDDIEVVKVSIYRNPVPGEGGGQKYIGDAVFVEGARPDIETQYPDYPLNSRAGWGYMLLTNSLPDSKHGRYHLHAVAEDKEGNTTTIGNKNIKVNNVTTVKPFGAIDSPAPNEKISGTAYVNWGWALTPLPNTIPFDGSTITVYIDGVPQGHPVYNVYRQDVADQFPGYNNSSGAGGYFTFDTTAFSNGRYTISWLVEDGAGNAEGIGSRYFKIKNKKKKGKDESNVVTQSRPVTDQPAEIGVRQLDVQAMQPIEFQVSNSFTSVRGYLSVNGELRALPVGSTLDHFNGRFYWVPVTGFRGTYQLVFFIEKADGTVESKNIKVNIATK